MGYYYNLKDDLDKYPDAIIYCIIGGRNRGKTYSALKYALDESIRTVFVKRTKTDVKLLCAGHSIGSKNNKADIDLSPYKPINRDTGSNIRPFLLPHTEERIGAFYNCNEDDEPYGLPVSYITSLNMVGTVKGFDMSDADWIIFDEFIPQPWERVNRKEDIQLLDLYKTVSRDREHRGQKPLKMMLLANAVSLACPVLIGFDLTDSIVQMQTNRKEYLYIEERGIIVHLVADDEAFRKKEEESPIYKAVPDSDWSKMALDNEFAYNDTSNVKKNKIKGYKCICGFYYKSKSYYVHQKGDLIVINRSRGVTNFYYDLTRENDQKAFYWDFCQDIRDATIRDLCSYSDYSVYDLIINYKKVFTI